MITLDDFLMLAIESDYKINIFDTETGTEILHQCEIGNIDEELEKIKKDDLLFHYIASWDIDYITKELCINIE
jgi:hypothetical protein